MSNVLNIYERNIPTVSIMKNAEEKSPNPYGMEMRFKQITEVTQADIDWCDILQMIRPSDPYSVFLAKRARESGCFVISMYDDDLYNPPKSRPTPAWRIACVKNALAQSNLLSTCSPHIREKYRDFTADKRAFSSDSVVNPSEIKEILPLSEQADSVEKVKLIYAANAGHTVFFNRFIMPVMPKLAERYAGKISMTFMGVNPDLSQYASLIDVELMSSMPLAEYRQKIQDGNYDIGLSPLISDEFTKCKYFNKFIEYTMAGIVGMYSNTEPYTYVVEDGVNGFLVNDDPEDWYEALCKVIDDALLRNHCVRNAQQLLKEKFTAESMVEHHDREIPELRNYSATRTPCKGLTFQRMLYRFIPIIDKVYQVFFYLKNSGISGLINKLKTHFREKKAFSE